MEKQRCCGCMNEIAAYPCPHCGFNGQDPKATAYTLPLGYLLRNRYLVGRVLGTGGFGITYLGMDTTLERKVAIKEFYPTGCVTRNSALSASVEWYTDERSAALRREGMASVLGEAQKMAKADSIPMVVRVREVMEQNNTAYIIMDYVEGCTLKQTLLRDGPMDWNRAESLFLPVVNAMSQVHRAGLVHRDISPDNLMILPDGTVTILDLGAAKDISGGASGPSAAVVKNGFSPFEQYAQRGSAGTWSDVYALAATMVYSLTGKLPVNAIDRAGGQELDWNDPRLLALPDYVRTALQRAMAVQIKDRTQTMDQFYRDLKGGSTGTVIQPGKKLHPGLLAGVLALVLVLVIALVPKGGEKKPTSLADKGGSREAVATETETASTQSPNEEAIPLARITEETEVFSGNGITITAKELSYSGYGVELQLSIENNYTSDIKVKLQESTVIINGISCEANLYADVATGTTLEESISIPYGNLEPAGIEVIGDLSFTLIVVDENYDEVTRTERIQLRTDEYGNYTQTIPSGQLLFEENGISVHSLGFVRDYYDNMALRLLVVNNNGNNISYTSNDSFAINGFMADAYVQGFVYAGTVYCEDVSIYQDELELLGITTPGQAAFQLVMREPDTYETLATTPILTVDSGEQGDFTAKRNPEDQLIYEGNGLRIYSQGAMEYDLNNSKTDLLKIYMEYTGSETIELQLDDTSVNGKEIFLFFSKYTLIPGTKNVCYLRGSIFDLEEENITQVNDIAFRIKIREEGDYVSIGESDILTFQGLW